MSRTRSAITACLFAIALPCALASVQGPPDPPANLRIGTALFQNGFEEANLTPSDGSLWQTLRREPSTNRVESSTDQVHSGSKSLLCFSEGRTASSTGKADIYKTNLNLRRGDTVRISAWYWIPANTYIKTITLMDVECSECGGTTEGIRIWIGNRLNASEAPHFILGRGKLGEPNIDAADDDGNFIPVPVGRWFEFTIEMRLGAGTAGRTRIWVDGDLDLDYTGTNIRVDHYNFFQVGITANSTGEPPGVATDLTIYVDDVRVMRR